MSLNFQQQFKGRRAASIGNMASPSDLSKKVPIDDDVDIDSDSSSDKKKAQPEPVPLQPPPAKLISNFKPDAPVSPKKERKSSSKRTEKPKRRSSAKNPAGNAIEPAPQLLFGAGDEEAPQHKKRKKSRSKDPNGKTKRKGRRSKKSSAADAQSFAPVQLSRSTERFDDSKSVVVKRPSAAITPQNPGRKPPLPDGRGIAGLARSQFAFSANDKPMSSSSSKKEDTMDDPYVTILTIPTDMPENVPKQRPIPKPKIGSLAASSSSLLRKSFSSSTTPLSSSANKTSSRLPLPVFPVGPGGGDGLTPIETMAETQEFQTNAFKEEKYDGIPKRRPLYEPDLAQPVAGWLKFQVPIVPKPDDVEYERQATKQFDIARLLHQAKTC